MGVVPGSGDDDATIAVADQDSRTVKRVEHPVGCRDIVLERKLLDASTLDRVLSVNAMTRGGIVGAEPTVPRQRQEPAGGEEGHERADEGSR